MQFDIQKIMTLNLTPLYIKKKKKKKKKKERKKENLSKQYKALTISFLSSQRENT